MAEEKSNLVKGFNPQHLERALKRAARSDRAQHAKWRYQKQDRPRTLKKKMQEKLWQATHSTHKLKSWTESFQKGHAEWYELSATWSVADTESLSPLETLMLKEEGLL